MIDFRYHLVSLAAVFLALAVGIALGAGPMKGQIGATLTEQVRQLRDEKAALRAERDVAVKRWDADQEFGAQALPRVMGGSMAGRSVVIVCVPGVDDALIKRTALAVGAAGGTVAGTIRLGQNWATTADDAQMLSLAKDLGLGSTVAPKRSALDLVLAASVLDGTHALAGVVPDRIPAVDPTKTAGMLAKLVSSGLLEADRTDITRADLAVMLAPAVPGDQSAIRDAKASRYTELATVLAHSAVGATVASDEGETTAVKDTSSVLTSVRRGGDAAKGISTVDNLGSAAGQASLVAALYDSTQGKTRHYGFLPGAEAPFALVPKTAP